MNNAGYTKESAMVVTRTTHRVTFYEGQRMSALLESLKHVPADAKIIEWSDGDSEKGEWPFIPFEQETEK